MKYYSLLTLLGFTCCLAACVDESITQLSADSKERLLSASTEKRWELVSRQNESLDNSCEWLVINEVSGNKRYQRMLACDGDDVVYESGKWSFNEGALGDIDSLLVERDTATIAFDTTYSPPTTSLIRSFSETENVTDTALIYRDTFDVIAPNWTLVDSIVTKDIDTLFAMIDTLFLLRDKDMFPSEFPVEIDTQFVVTDSVAIYLYNKLDIPQHWELRQLTVRDLIIIVEPAGEAITERYRFSE